MHGARCVIHGDFFLSQIYGNTEPIYKRVKKRKKKRFPWKRNKMEEDETKVNEAPGNSSLGAKFRPGACP